MLTLWNALSLVNSQRRVPCSTNHLLFEVSTVFDPPMPWHDRGIRARDRQCVPSFDPSNRIFETPLLALANHQREWPSGHPEELLVDTTTHCQSPSKRKCQSRRDPPVTILSRAHRQELLLSLFFVIVMDDTRAKCCCDRTQDRIKDATHSVSAC